MQKVTCLAANGVAVLQRIEFIRLVWEKTVIDIIAEIVIFFAIKLTYLNALLSFLLLSCFSA